MRSAPRALVPVLFAVLVIATTAAFAHTQRLKTKPLILDNVKVGGIFTPNGDCNEDKIRIRYRLTERDTVTMVIARPDDGPVVRTLVERRDLRAYRHFEFWWDGRDDQGRPAASGPYKVRVTLHERDRELEIGGRLRLHRGSYDPGPGCEKRRVRVPEDEYDDRAEP